MKFTTILGIIVLLGAAYIGFTGDLTDDLVANVVLPIFDYEEPTLNIQPREPFTGESITVANWNIQVFGESKWSKPEVREEIIAIVDDYDIIFIQEIRDSSETVFAELCAQVTTHDCSVSSRAGRSTSKEQYGVLFRQGIRIGEAIDYNNDEESQDVFERPPIAIDFIVDDYQFTAINIHVKPDDVHNELSALEEVAQDFQGNIMLLGDFNADGSYYDENEKTHFLEYEWVIDNSIDTTVAKSDNTYDRIILNNDMYKEYVSHGVFNDIGKEVSDHYVVWVEIATEES